MSGSKSFWLIAGALFLALVAYLTTCFQAVGPGEVVAVKRLGHLLSPPWTAGLHVGLPAGFDQRIKLRIDEVRRLAIGTAREEANSALSGRGEFLTGDRNLARVGAIVQFRIDDPLRYVLSTAEQDRVLAALAEEALASTCSQLEIDNIIRNKRQQFSESVLQRLAIACNTHQLGVGILSVNLVEAAPPEEVAPEFLDAQAAQSDRQRRETEAATEAEQIILRAQSRQKTTVDLAGTQAAHTRGLAQAKAERFLAILKQAAENKIIIQQRLYADALKRALQSPQKRLILEPDQNIDLSILE